MDTVGTFEMARALARHQLRRRAAQALHREDELRSPSSPTRTTRVASTPSIRWASRDHDYDKFRAVKATLGNAIEYVCVDVANGYTKAFIDFHKLRETYPDITIMAGNVVTGEMTEELILDGADIVKVGIGPGSVCTTRKMTGVGYPQLSAIIECADAAHGLGGLICADGGCTSPGDLAKAFGGGADFVMLGGMLAGHDECGRNRRTERQNQDALLRHELARGDGKIRRRRRRATAPRGQGGAARLSRPGGNTVQEILGGVRSACTYVGARTSSRNCRSAPPSSASRGS
jgi:GMP reductase